jgi:hypothetical protein
MKNTCIQFHSSNNQPLDTCREHLFERAPGSPGRSSFVLYVVRSNRRDRQGRETNPHGIASSLIHVASKQRNLGGNSKFEFLIVKYCSLT